MERKAPLLQQWQLKTLAAGEGRGFFLLSRLDSEAFATATTKVRAWFSLAGHALTIPLHRAWHEPCLEMSGLEMTSRCAYGD